MPILAAQDMILTYSDAVYTLPETTYVDENCDAPLTGGSIGWNGDVFLCCNIGKLLDNLRDKGFADIWMGDKYEELREGVNTRETMPQKCKTCPWVNRY